MKKSKSIEKRLEIQHDPTVLCAAVQCPTCEEIVISLGRHDMNKCGCGEVFIDGGFDYKRVGAKDLSKVKSFHVRVTKEYLK